MTFSFFYNLFLIILYVITAEICLNAFLRTRKKIYLLFSLLQISWILDAGIIYMIEFVPGDVSATTLHHPWYRLLITLLFMIFYTFIFASFLEQKVKAWFFAPELFYVLVASFFASASDQGNLWTIWGFYSARYFILLVQCVSFIYMFYHYLQAEERENHLRYLYFVIFLMATMSIGLFEQTVVIFNLEQFTLLPDRSFLMERSLAEDIYSVIACGLLFVNYRQDLFGQFKKDEILSPLDQAQQLATATASNPHPMNRMAVSTLPEDKMTAFQSFCKEKELTARECDILELLIQNYTIQEIADQLIISPGTVKTHTHNIYQKAGVEKRSQLLRMFH